MNYSDLSEKVEQAVCEYINVSTEKMFEYTKKGACVKARHLSIFILHTLYNIPISYLSLRYNLSVRHVFRAVAQIRDYMRYNKSYSDLLSNIVSRLPTM